MSKFLIATCLLALAIGVCAAPTPEGLAPKDETNDEASEEAGEMDVSPNVPLDVCIERFVGNLTQLQLAPAFEEWNNLDEVNYEALGSPAIWPETDHQCKKLHAEFDALFERVTVPDNCEWILEDDKIGATADHPALVPYLNALMICEATRDYAESREATRSEQAESEQNV